MACLKQERLWSVEAAIANIESIRQQKALHYPAKRKASALDKALEILKKDDPDPTPRRDVLVDELTFIRPYVDDMRSHLSLENKAEQVSELLIDFSDLRNEAKQLCTDDFPWWDTVQSMSNNCWQRFEDDFDGFSKVVLDAVGQIEARITELETAIATIDQLDQASDQARITQESIQKPDLFARYQTTITRDLHLAIDRLISLQERRIEASITSFGNN